MDRESYPWDEERRKSGLRPRLVFVVVVFLIVGAIIAVLYPPIEATHTGIPVSRKVSQQVYPADVVSSFEQPAGERWLLPAGVARIGELTFVVDSGNDRILKLDEEARVLGILDRSSDERLDLQQPMAIATDGTRLFVANSLTSEVLVLDTSGVVEKAIALEGQPGDKAPRPIGIAAGPDGTIVVSDAENHRVLFLDGDGKVVNQAGNGLRADGRDGFNVPAAITTDAAGHIYVVDTLNGRVVKLSRDGAFLGEFGKLADTAGSLARPKGVAVDAAGRVFVSDGLQAAIEVFGPDGTYLGVIGRRDPDDAKAGSIFEAPAALLLAGDRLNVIDGIAGLITLRLSEPPVQPAIAAE